MTPDPAQVDVAELRALLEAATPGPWHTDGQDIEHYFPHIGESGVVSTCGAETDAAFIAAARNALPALLDRLEAAEAKVAAVEALADEWTDDHRIRMEAGAIYDLGNGKRACEVWYEKPNRHKWHGEQIRAALEQR